MSVVVRSLRVIVSSDHPYADEQVAEAIARVVSRYAVDLTGGIEVSILHDGVGLKYVVRAAMNLASAVRAARRPPAGLDFHLARAA